MLIPSPKWLDSGSNAWQMAAATFVALQSIPGLVVLYGGIVKKKWAINSAFMAMYAFAAVLLVWLLWAYNMGFGEQWLPFVGKPGPVAAAGGELTQRSGPGRGLRHAAVDIPDGHSGVLPVRVCRHHRHHSGGLSARPHELQGLDHLCAAMDPACLYHRRIQPVGRWLDGCPGRRRLLGRLCDPSGRRHVRLRRSRHDRATTASRPRALPAQQSARRADRRRRPLARLERL